MNIVFFTHPEFLSHQSMPRFARMLAKGMQERNHKVEILNPKPRLFQLPAPKALKKWLGYIDQYILFPIEIRQKLIQYNKETLFVFCDHALGPWVLLVKGYPHVVHCHDFLAQFSALGEIEENPTGWTGRLYQNFIRKGFSKAINYISVSEKTRLDLLLLLGKSPVISEVVYNGFNQEFVPIDQSVARTALNQKLGLVVSEGFILHVGGNQWYKNRRGVIEIYNSWRSLKSKKLPLLLIGETPDAELIELKSLSVFKEDIHFLSNLSDETVRLAYCGASVFLFPSLAEGFGWPIAEAMASGCPVITTDEAPMTEVAGNAGFLIVRYPRSEKNSDQWAFQSAKMVERVIHLSHKEREEVVSDGIINARRFDTQKALDRIELIYKEILEKSKK